MNRKIRIDRVIAVSLAVLIVGGWELAARRAWVDPMIFPAPTAILRDYKALWNNGLLLNIGLTLARFLGGLACGAIPGIALGLVLGWSARMTRILDPFIAAIHPVPKIVVFPILIVVFGMSEFSKTLAVALTVFFPTLINTAAGVRQISPLYYEVIRSYGGSGAALLRHVIIPGSLPLILTGIRVSANLGLLVTTAIEFTIGSKGIGSIIWLSWQTLRIEDLYAGVLALSVIGFTVSRLLNLLLARATPWQTR